MPNDDPEYDVFISYKSDKPWVENSRAESKATATVGLAR